MKLEFQNPQRVLHRGLAHGPGQHGQHERAALAPDVAHRVAETVGASDAQRGEFRALLQDGLLPAESIVSGVDSQQQCLVEGFVQPVGDALTGRDHAGRPGITVALAQAAETLRLGGRVSYDFSAVRPVGAAAGERGALAPGVLKCMAVFDRVASIVVTGSCAARQFGLLRVDHPDIEAFLDAVATGRSKRGPCVTARQTGVLEPAVGQVALRSFRLGVGLSDAFMRAVLADGDFDLVHEASPQAPGAVLQSAATGGGADTPTYRYRTVRARALWTRLLQHLPHMGAPGMVFVDRVSHASPWRDLEHPSTAVAGVLLPAYACCARADILVPACVRDAYSPHAIFDVDKFRHLVRGGVRFLDRVLDVSSWPLPQHRDEAMAKRRIGLGHRGVPEAIAMMGLVPGSQSADRFAAELVRMLREEACRESTQLARELGAFPLFHADAWRGGGAACGLPADLQDGIRTHGLRNLVQQLNASLTQLGLDRTATLQERQASCLAAYRAGALALACTPARGDLEEGLATEGGAAEPNAPAPQRKAILRWPAVRGRLAARAFSEAGARAVRRPFAWR